MQVNFYATLRQIVGQKTVEIELPEGATVRLLIDRILLQFPLLRKELLDNEGMLYGHVHVLVNGRDAPFLEDALETVLKPDDSISVFPAIGGGKD